MCACPFSLITLFSFSLQTTLTRFCWNVLQQTDIWLLYYLTLECVFSLHLTLFHGNILYIWLFYQLAIFSSRKFQKNTLPWFLFNATWPFHRLTCSVNDPLLLHSLHSGKLFLPNPSLYFLCWWVLNSKFFRIFLSQVLDKNWHPDTQHQFEFLITLYLNLSNPYFRLSSSDIFISFTSCCKLL